MLNLRSKINLYIFGIFLILLVFLFISVEWGDFSQKFWQSELSFINFIWQKNEVLTFLINVNMQGVNYTASLNNAGFSASDLIKSEAHSSANYILNQMGNLIIPLIKQEELIVQNNIASSHELKMLDAQILEPVKNIFGLK